MIWDVFTYNGEKDMLRLHLGALYDHVDKFIIVEAKTTFSGKEKPLYFSEHEHDFKRYWKKIDYHIINEKYTPEEKRLAESSPNTQGAKHWKTEFLQKESIKKALTTAHDDDTIVIGDVDEIWDPSVCLNHETPIKFKMRVYAYYLDNHSNEEFWGPIASPYKYIKTSCLNHLRTNAPRSLFYGGWHFTSMGGVKEVRRKLNDSYTKESYNTDAVQEMLEQRVGAGVDYLGRPFKFAIDESEWPAFLKENKKYFTHLCFPKTP